MIILKPISIILYEKLLLEKNKKFNKIQKYVENRRNIINIFFCYYRILFKKNRRKKKFSTSACDSLTIRKSQNSLHNDIESIYQMNLYFHKGITIFSFTVQISLFISFLNSMNTILNLSNQYLLFGFFCFIIYF